MKIIVRIMSLLMTGVLMVGLLTSCSKNSLRPHDALPPIKPLFMHVGYVGSTSASYAKYTDNDIQKLTDIGVNEVCIAYGTAPVTYIPEGGTEPELLITKDDINAITADMVGGNPSQADLDNLKAQYRSKINPLDEDLLLNDYADMTLEFAERCPELFSQLCESGAQVGLLAAGEPDFAREIARAQEVFLARGLTLTHVMPADDKKAGPLSTAAHEAGLATMVCTFELRARSTDPAGLVAKVKDSLFDGAVVRFEPTLLTVEAFPQIVEAIRERGLVFNTLTSANSQ